MFEFFLKGGVLMWPILLCSIAVIAIILERSYRFYEARTRVPNLFAKVKRLLHDGRPEEALKLCENIPSPVAHILAVGIHIRKRGREEKEKIIAMAGTRVVRGLDKNLRILAVIGSITPLLGLLGTVTGMIKAFMKIQELGGRVDASVLAGGIWEALITTAFGLSVAIPALVACYYFEGRVDDISAEMRYASTELLDIQNEHG